MLRTGHSARRLGGGGVQVHYHLLVCPLLELESYLWFTSMHSLSADLDSLIVVPLLFRCTGKPYTRMVFLGDSACDICLMSPATARVTLKAHSAMMCMYMQGKLQACVCS